MVNLLGLTPGELQAFCVALGEKPYRAKQLVRWIHQVGTDDFGAMTDIAKSLRERLAEAATIAPPPVRRDTTAADGTRKWLLDVGTGNAIETVFIPEADRGTLCISSQAGCALECSFCSTGRQGFNRNLTTAEIIGQLWHANRALGRGDSVDRPITNVVMMGMGEPLANFDNVVAAMQLMLDDSAYSLSRRRVTLSTSGLVPAMDRLRELLAACVRYVEKAPREFVMFEYVMLDGVNDTLEHARELVALVADVPCKINLIPFNPFPGSGYARSKPEAIARFQDVLVNAYITTTVRRTRGDDIDAACGQLAGEVQDRTRRVQRREKREAHGVNEPQLNAPGRAPERIR